MNKEDSIKEKFKQALISTYKVISDDYKVDRNNKKEGKIPSLFNYFDMNLALISAYCPMPSS